MQEYLSTKSRTIQLILNVYVLGFGVCLFVNWIRINYFDINIYQYWSFKAEDPPWMPSPQASSPILGKHHFGDFQLPIGWARSANPYELGNSNILPPVGMYFYKAMSIFSVQISYLLYSILTFIVLICCLSEILKYLPKNLKIQTLSVLTGLSLPIYIAFDRGAAILLACSLTLFGYLLFNKERTGRITRSFSIGLIILGVSLKPYLVVVILLWGLKNKVMIWKYLIPGLILSNLILSFSFTGGLNQVIRNLIDGYMIQVGKDNPGWLYSGVSFSAGICRASYLFLGPEESLKFVEQYQKFSWLPGLIVITILVASLHVFAKIWSTKFFIGTSLICLQLIVPVSMSYTLIWSSFSVAIILSDFYQQKLNRIATIRYVLPMIGFISLLLPLPLRNYLLITSFIATCTFLSMITISIFELRQTRKGDYDAIEYSNSN